MRLLEREPHVGGLAASFTVAGVRVDHGSHRLHPATPEPILADLRTLMGPDLQTRRRKGRLRLGQRWTPFPLRPAELARDLAPGVLARLGIEALAAPFRRPHADTYAEVLRAGLGPTAYRLLYAPYAEKLWGLRGDLIDGEQARVRVTAGSPAKVAARMLRGGRGGSGNRGGSGGSGSDGGRGDGRGRIFYYPRRGFGQLSEALAAAAIEAGADIRLGSAVVEISAWKDGAVLRDADGGRVLARHVLSTLPVTALARLVSPGPPAAVRTAAAGLEVRAMVLVHLVHEGGRWSDYDAHYLPGRETPVTRISEPANYRVSADDPSDRSVLCAELPCRVGDQAWRSPDASLAEVVRATLAVTGLPPVRGTDVEVRRLPSVYPVYGLGYGERLAVVEDWVSGLPWVTSFGRLGVFAHDNTHHALAMAAAAVASLDPDGHRDPVAWAAARRSFAAHVVED